MGNSWNEIDNFIKDQRSICREERQYALYLANVLRRFPDAKTFRVFQKDKAEGHWLSTYHFDGYKIENVFYEATFMRDCFTREREEKRGNSQCSFNQLLMDYIIKKIILDDKLCIQNDFKCILPESDVRDLQSMLDRSIDQILYAILPDLAISDLRYWHLGAQQSIALWKKQSDERISCELNRCTKMDGKKIEQPRVLCKRLTELVGYIARCMMNAKPDLAIWYKANESDKASDQASMKGDLAQNQKIQKPNLLCFIECKFESGEGDYKFECGNIRYILRQTQVQKWILCFLKDDVYGEDQLDIAIHADSIPKYIRFSRKASSYYDEATQSLRVPIAELIKLNNSIFEGI